jgi:carbamoyl-phosphate synthase large subunit
MDPDAYGFELADESAVVPAGDDEAYIPQMTAVADRTDADIVLPLTTAELQPLARNRDAFDATVMVSEAQSLSVANDKGRLYDFLESEGFDAAPTFRRVNSMDAFVEACHELGYPESPVCFKRPVASGMRGFRVLEPETDRLTRLLSEKPTTAVTTLEQVRPVLAEAESFPELVVMEYLPGDEYSVDVLALGDETGPVIPRSRTETRAGITFKGTVEPRSELQTAAAAIASSLGLEYNINIQFKYDAEGTPKVIEINPRVAGTIVMCVGAGANLPYLAVKYALDEPLPDVDIEWGTQMVRYWQELFHRPDGETYRFEEAPLRSHD